jgi:hypothetical protein
LTTTSTTATTAKIGAIPWGATTATGVAISAAAARTCWFEITRRKIALRKHQSSAGQQAGRGTRESYSDGPFDPPNDGGRCHDVYLLWLPPL